MRHFTGLQSLLSTLQQAYQELGLLMLLMAVTVITISRSLISQQETQIPCTNVFLLSLIYFAEKEGGRDRSWTFLESFWFGLMALTRLESNID